MNSTAMLAAILARRDSNPHLSVFGDYTIAKRSAALSEECRRIAPACARAADAVRRGCVIDKTRPTAEDKAEAARFAADVDAKIECLNKHLAPLGVVAYRRLTGYHLRLESTNPARPLPNNAGNDAGVWGVL